MRKISMVFIPLFIFSTLLTIQSCGSKKVKNKSARAWYNELNGKSKSEVKNILGSPDSHSDGYKEFYTYRSYYWDNDTDKWDGDLVIGFSNDRVDNVYYADSYSGNAIQRK